MIHRHGDKTRWDKTPADYDDTKNPERRGAGKSQDPNDRERYSGRHDWGYRHRDQPRHGKENGTDTSGEKHKRPAGYMRGWDDGDARHDEKSQGGHYYRKEDKEHGHRKEYEIDRHTGYRSKHEDGPRHGDSTSGSRLHHPDNDIDARSGYRSRGLRDHGKEDGKRSHDEHLMEVKRGRGRERSPTLTREDSTSSSSGSSSHVGTKGSGSHSSQSRDRRASERSPHTSSKRKYSRSRSGSRESSEEREKKRKKKHKRKDKSSKRDKDKEERRSVLTGKKIKLKVKKGRDDHERDANRQELLQFLNAAYE